jgi:DNA mismatch repair protein MutS2
MNVHTLALLEFPEVLQSVSSRAGSELGRKALLNLRPARSPEGARRELARVEESCAFLGEAGDWAPPLPPDARSGLRILGAEGGVLDPPQLLRLGRLLEAAHELGQAFDRMLHAETYPELRRLRARLPRLPAPEARIRETVDDEARVRDRASSDLAQIRRRIQEVRQRIVGQLEALLDRLPERVRVPDASVSIREGRYVIPIRREGRGEVGGVVLGESGTGATLFVEPPLAARLVGQLLEFQREEAAEIQRILRALTGELRPHRGALSEALAALIDFDTLWARARTARSWGAARPELLDPGEEGLQIRGGRHPLLIEKGISPVVPFDLELDPDERAVVISGPNTGGKTVLLKAVGLTFLLAQSGIFPPVRSGTRLPWMRRVVADIGDEQSIEASLSTFSAHLANAREIVEAAEPGTLVLMDEMGTGTDPAEGAALARAILETLVGRGARALVTSHLGALKRLDGAGSGIVNASLRFDSQRIEPTYHFLKGTPGRSYGLAIARRLGFPGDVLDRAEALVDSGELELERLLETLEGKDRALSQALEESVRSRDAALRLESDLRARMARLEEREQDAERRAREEARRFLLAARAEVESAIQAVQGASQAAQEEAAREARRRVEEAAREVTGDRARPKGQPRKGGQGRPVALAVGDPVRLTQGGARGAVVGVEGGRVLVEISGLRLQVPASSVEKVGEVPTPRPRPRGAIQIPELEGRPEADLRGLRVEEVGLILGRAVDAAILSGLHQIRIIHGKGTGAVKARVLEVLGGDPRILEARPGIPSEGGGGVTIAVFR